MSQKKEFIKDTFVYGLGSGIKKFIGLFLLPFYTRALSPSDYGIIDTLATGVFFLSAFLNMGYYAQLGSKVDLFYADPKNSQSSMAVALFYATGQLIQDRMTGSKP